MLATGLTLKDIPCGKYGTLDKYVPDGDYVVIKFARWAFEKFKGVEDKLGTQMRAVGEVMSIGKTYKEAFQKAIRSLETGRYGLGYAKDYNAKTKDQLLQMLITPSSDRHFIMYEALRKGATVEEIFDITKVKTYFIQQMKELVEEEEALAAGKGSLPSDEMLTAAKKDGFSDKYLSQILEIPEDDIRNRRLALGVEEAWEGVHVSGTPDSAYYYSTYNAPDKNPVSTDKPKIMILGGGPNRIGQGIEFDYCSVHSVWALKKMGCETIIINNNPETVSTDFDVADKLYFEPLTPEDVAAVVHQEKPWGAVVQFGGQTAIKLAQALTDMGVFILGTSADGVDAAEDRERFDEILNECGIPRAKGETVFTAEEALKAANAVGYPVLVRPSYVLGGQGMEIAYNDRNIIEFMRVINQTVQEHPILVDKYLMGREVEVDGVFDGEDILIPGIMEHVERAGIHSGDSISVYPPLHIEEKHKETILRYTRDLARALGVIGLVNIQFILYNDEVYVIEVNPRSSRTIPYISKVTGVPIIDLATRVMLGEKLKDLGYGTGVYPEAKYYAVKMPVFSFEKLTDVDTGLGPEMKSTGEVLGLAENFPQALRKAFKGANLKAPKKGGRAIITVKDEDKGEIVGIARGFADMGVELYATAGTRQALLDAGIDCKLVARVSEAHPNIADMIASGTVDLIINTPTHGRRHESDGFKIRRMAVEHSVSCVTAIDTARAMLTVRTQSRSAELRPIDITEI